MSLREAVSAVIERGALLIASPDELRSQARELTDLDSQLSAQLQILENDLDGFDSSGYTHFKDVVLPKRLDALAHQLMATSEADDQRDARLELRGAYKEVRKMMTKSETLQNSIRELREDRVRVLTKLKAVQEEIKRDADRRRIE